MFWRKRAARLAAMEAQMRDLAAIVSQLASVKEPAVNAAVNTIATAAIESRAKEMESLGGFLRVVSEIGTERAARALGRRRANTAKRGPNGKFLPNGGRKDSTCRLCRNSQITDPSIEEIREHTKHGAAALPPAITYTHEPDRVVAHVHEDLIQHGPDGEQLECPDCAPKGTKWN